MPDIRENPHNEYTSEWAKEFMESGKWERLTAREKTELQLAAEFLCMPFNEFHRAISQTLGRSVYTHEFALNWDGLCEEVFNGAEPPSIEEIIDMLPADKTIILIQKEEE